VRVNYRRKFTRVLRAGASTPKIKNDFYNNLTELFLFNVPDTAPLFAKHYQSSDYAKDYRGLKKD
jgi:hypothetical protein